MALPPARLLATKLVIIVVAWCGPLGATTPDEPVDVRLAVVKLESWLDGSDQADAWRGFLLNDQLHEQMRRGAGADVLAVETILTRFSSPTPGLEQPAFHDVRDTLVAWRARLLGPSKAELPDAVIAAKSSFQPVTEAQVQSARAAALLATQELRRFLANEPNGDGWRVFLLLDQVERGLRSDAPDVSDFVEPEKKAAVGREALKQPAFRSYADKLNTYIARLRVFSEGDMQARYELVLDLLAEALETYEREHDAKSSNLLGLTVDRLEERQQAPLLTAALRRYYWEPYPNLFVELSARLATEGFHETVDQVQRIEDYIDGARVVGSGRTRGELVGSLKPNDTVAELENVFSGRVHSDTTAYASQAIVQSLGTTDFNATKRLLFDSQGFHGEYPKARACSRGQPYCVTAILPNKNGCKLNELEIARRLEEKKRQLLQPIADRIAWKQVEKRQGRTDYFASRNAQRRIAEQFEKRAEARVQQADDAYQDRFRRPLMRFGAFPERIEFSTTETQLRIVAQKARGSELSALESPPEVFVDADMMVRMHETVLNNMAHAMYGGRTLTRESMNEEFNAFRRTPQPAEEKGASWTIEFAQADPILVRLRDGQIRIIFHGEGFSFTKGTDFETPMVVVVDYALSVSDDGGLLGTRIGAVTALPPGADPDNVKLSVTQAQLQENLVKAFSELFPETSQGRRIELPERWRSAGELRLRKLRCQDRWLSLGYFLTAPIADESKVEVVRAP